jgi:hypothetical protein
MPRAMARQAEEGAPTTSTPRSSRSERSCACTSCPHSVTTAWILKSVRFFAWMLRAMSALVGGISLLERAYDRSATLHVQARSAPDYFELSYEQNPKTRSTDHGLFN